jgi:hypothetical protein
MYIWHHFFWLYGIIIPVGMQLPDTAPQVPVELQVERGRPPVPAV